MANENNTQYVVINATKFNEAVLAKGTELKAKDGVSTTTRISELGVNSSVISNSKRNFAKNCNKDLYEDIDGEYGLIQVLYLNAIALQFGLDKNRYLVEKKSNKPVASGPRVVGNPGIEKQLNEILSSLEAMNNRITQISNRTIELKKQHESMNEQLDNIYLGMSELKEDIKNIEVEDSFSKAKAEMVSLFRNSKEIEEGYAVNRCKEMGINGEIRSLAMQDLGIRVITKHTGARSIKRYWALPYGEE